MSSFSPGEKKMDEDSVLRIERVECHYWPACECVECEKERARRAPPQHPLHSMSVDTAHVLGFLSSRCPEGSLARRIAEQESPEGGALPNAPERPLAGG